MNKRRRVITNLFLNKGLREKHIGRIYNISATKVTKLLVKWKIKNNDKYRRRCQ